MQSANRAKQLKEVELDRAEVHDDGKWEMDQEVKDEWGPSSSAKPSSAPETSAKGRKVHPRPISISACGSSRRLRGFEQLKEQKNAKTAMQVIPDTFLRPSGVDDPKALDSSRSIKTVIDGTRMKRLKRDRDGAADLSTQGKTPKKKKKKTVEG
ncbi:hypothetical protein K443DRAFT_127547 [Laccaria amethystina LaAM-08-1]|uniref:Uncharacterized protein n=1 Tax=Laccaria amethystina LaAM-08-1 TaxID=1095629 RepID=A0A0C9Y6Q2_9AGAR|nr:hypothetical protein K443DRAFT_127547 [Laccaria amethystina LaAM-08-1]